MPSEDGALNEPLDERLAEARNALLDSGESIVAQEMGDPGQAIVLTDSRVMILKSGLTATGEFNGNRAGVYSLSEVTAVNVRKGPMGAVIQVCTDKQETPSQSGPPDNVIVFGGAQRSKKCEAIAAQIEVAIGKPATRTKPGKAPKAESPVVEQVVETQAPAEAPELPVVEQVAAPTAYEAPAIEDEVEEEEPEQSTGFRPNPNLPKPSRRPSGSVNRALVLLAVLGAMLLVGLAVTAPLRQPAQQRSYGRPTIQTTRTPEQIKAQLADVESYRSEMDALVKNADAFAAELEGAARSGAPQILHGDEVEVLWAAASSSEPPAGLAGAKESIVTGMGGLRTAATSLAGSAQQQDDTLQRITGARELMMQGMRSIDAMVDRIRGELGGR